MDSLVEYGGKPPCIVASKNSLTYVPLIVKTLKNIIEADFRAAAPLFVCDRVDEAPIPRGSIVFVVGESFPRFTKKPGCLYLYLNFSVVEFMGNPMSIGLSGLRQVGKKRRMLREKLDCFDVLLDFLPLQTTLLQHRLDMPVMHFPPCVDPALLDESPSPNGTPYDVCFVGGATARRRAVLRRIETKGLSLSPSSEVILEEIAARSSLCLNIHAARSNHLETPRIVGALAAGCPVVTEKSFGIRSVFPADIVIAAPLVRLPSTVRELLQDRARLDDLRQRSTEWYRSVYFPEAQRRWGEICSAARAMAEVV